MKLLASNNFTPSFYLTLHKKLIAFEPVRATFPLMLAASLIVHLLVLGGAALATSFGSPAKKLLSPVEKAPTLTFLRPLPVRPTSAPARMAHIESQPAPLTRPAAASSAAAPPVPAVLPVKNVAPPAVAKTAPEANPNANLPSAAPEAVLAPVPAPKLDGTKGVVFILDISGSMYEPYAGATRLTFARQALSERVLALPDGTPSPSCSTPSAPARAARSSPPAAPRATPRCAS